MTLRNSRGLGVTNGTRGDVLDVEQDRREVRIRTDEGHEVTLPRSYLEAGHMTHTYAITGHKAQGMTASRAFVLGDEMVYREWGYEAMSRGKDEKRLSVVAGEDQEPGRDPTTPVARALAESRAKAMAIELESPAYIRNTLGDRLLSPTARDSWSQAVFAIEQYRERYQLAAPQTALRARLAEGLRRADYDVTAKVVEKAIGRDLAVERGIELRQEKGLGLSR